MAMSFLRLDELIAMVRVKVQYADVQVNLRPEQEDLKWCYDILKAVSRSFAVVIVQLNEELRDAVNIFYLVLRGLDTVEDDMSIPLKLKQELLPTFHEKLLDDKWCVSGIGEGRERELLEHFYRVSKEFMKLKPAYRDVISDICATMAEGMLKYLNGAKVVSTDDYDEYCYYVAGLVGHGLTRLFVASGLEDKSLTKDLHDTMGCLANSMGIMLQKTNITRDVFEDLPQQRLWWPKAIWGMFVPNVEDLVKPGFENRARECLHAMIANALQHIPACLDYLAALREPSVLSFCAIPQLHAIATLSELIANPNEVYKTKVKISKGAACKIIMNCTDMPTILQMYESYLQVISDKLDENDPSYDVSRKLIDRGFAAVKEHSLKCSGEESPSYARRFLTQYPALGGRVLFNLVDSARAFLKPAQV